MNKLRAFCFLEAHIFPWEILSKGAAVQKRVREFQESRKKKRGGRPDSPRETGLEMNAIGNKLFSATAKIENELF